MTLIERSIRQPVTVAVVVLLIVIFGIIGFLLDRMMGFVEMRLRSI